MVTSLPVCLEIVNEFKRAFELLNTQLKAQVNSKLATVTKFKIVIKLEEENEMERQL